MLTESNGRAEVDAPGGDLPTGRLPSKGERRDRNTPRRAKRSPLNALNGSALAELGEDTTALQARFSYEATSGNPEGGTDGPSKPPLEVTSAANETTSTRFVAAKFTCEVYGASGSGTDAKVTFTEVDPGSGNPEGGTDHPIRTVVVKLHIAQQAAKPKAQTDSSATSLSRLFTEEPVVDQLASPT